MPWMCPNDQEPMVMVFQDARETGWVEVSFCNQCTQVIVQRYEPSRCPSSYTAYPPTQRDEQLSS